MILIHKHIYLPEWYNVLSPAIVAVFLLDTTFYDTIITGSLFGTNIYRSLAIIFFLHRQYYCGSISLFDNSCSILECCFISFLRWERLMEVVVIKDYWIWLSSYEPCVRGWVLFVRSMSYTSLSYICRQVLLNNQAIYSF